MLDLIYTKLMDSQFLLSILAAIATMATIVTVAMPLIETDTLTQRMKAVATERESIRARERARLLADKSKQSLRQEPKVYMKQIVERFKAPTRQNCTWRWPAFADPRWKWCFCFSGW